MNRTKKIIAALTTFATMHVANVAVAQTDPSITPEAKIAARELHELGMREWYQANFEKAEELLVESVVLAPKSEYLLDAAGIYLAQRKIDPAYDYIERAKAASLSEFGQQSLAYADSLAIEAEIAALDGNVSRAKEATLEADGIYLNVIMNPPEGIPFVREQALFSYGQNCHNYVSVLIADKQYELAATKLHGLRQFYAEFDTPLPDANRHALLLGEALSGLGRFDEAVAALSAVDVAGLLTSHERAANQIGLRIAEARVDVMQKAGLKAESSAFLTDIQRTLAQNFDDDDPRLMVLERINAILEGVSK